MMIVFDVVEVIVGVVKVKVKVIVDVATFEIAMAHLGEHQCGALWMAHRNAFLILANHMTDEFIIWSEVVSSVDMVI